MRAAVIAIGDEITSGQRVDTNSAWISIKLGELGIPVALHATAPDDLDACTDVLAFACKQADLVVATGGLGPTQDDLTREAIAALCGTPLELHEPSRVHIVKIFATRGRKMPESNLRQALLPRGSRAIENPNGTAPGIAAHVNLPDRNARVIALPGVPAEMREMWSTSVESTIVNERDSGTGNQLASPTAIVHRTLKCFGIGESALEEQIAEFLRRGRQPTIGITAHRATISLRLTSRGLSPSECQAALQQDIREIRERLGELVFGEGDEELQHVVVRELTRRNASLVTSERVSRGLLARWLSAVAETTHYAGGVVRPAGTCPSLDSLAKCREEATRLRTEHGTQWAIVVGDMVLGESAAEIPLVVQSESSESAKMSAWAGHPDIRAECAAKMALNLLRKQLLQP